MADYFEEMGWQELRDGEQPNHLLHMARFLIDFGMYEDNFTGEWPRLPPPASKEVVNNLPEITITEDKNCPICLKNLHVGDKAKEMPCHHVFHATCILTWLDREERLNKCEGRFHSVFIQYKNLLPPAASYHGLTNPCSSCDKGKCHLLCKILTNSCPFCRHELPTDNEAYEAFKKEKKRAEQRKEDIETLHNSMFS